MSLRNIYGYFLQQCLDVLKFFVYFYPKRFIALTHYLCTNVLNCIFLPNASLFSKYYLFFIQKMRIIQM